MARSFGAMKIPLNRIVAFLGPYLALVSGAVAAWLIAKVNVLGLPDIGVSEDQLTTYLTAGGTWLLTSVLVWLGHSKWLTGHHIILQAAATVSARTLDPPVAPAQLTAGDPVASDDEPGDPDALPELATAVNPPPDGNDQVLRGLVEEAAGHQALAGSYSRLNDSDRAIARRLFIKGVEVLMSHPAQLHYSQDMTLRWEGIRDRIVPWTASGKLNGKYPKHGDCSSTGEYLMWLAFAHHFHLADLLSAEAWKAGWTGSLVQHGKPVHDWSKLKVGDAVFYGPSIDETEHVTWSIGGRRVFSHGSEAGPFLLDFEYRSDIVAIRRYI